ncbi:MAG: hypothetical protein KatS3mg132_463 [Limisphaera sp.]|nr:MAG: hypothetical protein KatS3mg132_463 [Limisphaera sp.]
MHAPGTLIYARAPQPAEYIPLQQGSSGFILPPQAGERMLAERGP